MRILVACEESQAVTKELRRLGHEAYSCDIQPCSGGHPEWHLQVDALELLKLKWDMIIAHPPCTYLTNAGAVRLRVKGEINQERMEKAKEAKKFFMAFLEADCPKKAIENPVPGKIHQLPPYSQIIEPYMFGDPWKKRTCLWLRGLPPPHGYRAGRTTGAVGGCNQFPARCACVFPVRTKNQTRFENQKRNLPRNRQSNGGTVGWGCEGGKR